MAGRDSEVQRSEEFDLEEACRQAPSHGLNAKALILQASMAQDDDEAPPLRDPAAEGAVAAARRGPDYLAAVDIKQRPLVAYVPRSKIPRINRQTVLGKLAGEHLALAAGSRQPPLDPQAAAADLQLRQPAFEAALAQELALYKRCGSAQARGRAPTPAVYQNLAARTSATQWPQPGGISAPPSQQPEQPSQHPQQPQQRQPQQPRPAKRAAPVSSSGSAGGQAAVAAAQCRAAASAAAAAPKRRKAVQLVEADIDWGAAVPESQQAAAAAEREAGASGSRGAAPAQPAPGTAAALPSSAQTVLGGEERFKPLATLPPEPAGSTGTEAPHDELSAGEVGAGAGAMVEQGGPAAGPGGEGHASGGAPAEPAPAGAAAPDSAAAAGCGAQAQQAQQAQQAVRQQVELFIRAELHPLLRRGQIGRELHDAVCSKAARKVMESHPGATSADFLVPEAGSVRALVRRYLRHLQQQPTKPPVPQQQAQKAQ